MESDKNWVHKPESAFNDSTKSALIVMGTIFAVALLVALFFLKSHLPGSS